MMSMSFWTGAVSAISLCERIVVSGERSRTAAQERLGSLSLKPLDSIVKTVLTSRPIGSLFSKSSLFSTMRTPSYPLSAAFLSCEEEGDAGCTTPAALSMSIERLGPGRIVSGV